MNFVQTPSQCFMYTTEEKVEAQIKFRKEYVRLNCVSFAELGKSYEM